MESKNRTKKKSNALGIVIVLLLALLLIVIASRHLPGQSFPNYTSFSRERYGVSLLFDTLRHLQFPVFRIDHPVNEFNVDPYNVVFIIQPTNPRLNNQMAENILSWVQQGGKLIYLENRSTTIIDQMLQGYNYSNVLNLRWYRVGRGQVITGPADIAANINLMENPIYGEALASVIYSWNPERVYFAEYYHGFRASDGAFRQMPLWLQLMAVQILIATAIFMWHFGKRFGEPVPLYEEVEREENEQVLVLARLYKRARK